MCRFTVTSVLWILISKTFILVNMISEWRPCSRPLILIMHFVPNVSKSKVNRWIYTALYYKPFISQVLRYGPCVTMGSHSFTCHPYTHHTYLYSPVTRHHRPLACTHCAYPWRDGQAELTWVTGHIPKINVPHWELSPNTVTHPSTNRAWRGLTSLIETNAVMLRHADHVYLNQSMERILEVGLGGQCTPRGRPHNPTTGLCSPSTTVVSPEPF